MRKNRNPDDYCMTGGLRFGRGRSTMQVNISWPFVRLAATREKIIVNIRFIFYRKSFEFLRNGIIGVEPVKLYWTRGVRIRHCLPQIPEYFVFLHRKPEMICELLNSRLKLDNH